ncbi:MAG: N-acetylmuramoyl-L-alanine amidase [Acidaminococcaceae bacterium]|nr:N-acetylmuramoyl-L-alanine amidase [Acidaminococcaceae bacterium]MBR1589551.1 N-acetylmuramoyl-L-alanine amidase [Acidaminococcaceae bacterium]
MSEAKQNVIEEKALKAMARAARGKVQRIFLHWSGGHYGQNCDEYHLCVDCDGQVYANCQRLNERKAHTWLRNSGSLAISLLCGYGGNCWVPDDGNVRTLRAVYAGDCNAGSGDALIKFGPEPPTVIQIEVMARLVAVLCTELELVIDKDNVQTHCEIAFKDHYGPGSGDPYTKWDLWFLPDAAQQGKLIPGGALLRGKALFYQQELREAA